MIVSRGEIWLAELDPVRGSDYIVGLFLYGNLQRQSSRKRTRALLR